MSRLNHPGDLVGMATAQETDSATGRRKCGEETNTPLALGTLGGSTTMWRSHEISLDSGFAGRGGGGDQGDALTALTDHYYLLITTY